MIVSLQLAPETRRRKPELGAELTRNFRSWNRRGVINSVRAVLVDRDSTLGRASIREGSGTRRIGQGRHHSTVEP